MDFDAEETSILKNQFTMIYEVIIHWLCMLEIVFVQQEIDFYALPNLNNSQISEISACFFVAVWMCKHVLRS